MRKSIAIDYGLSRVGIAVSDYSGSFAKPLKSIRYNGDEQLANDIIKIVESKEIEIIVIGNPVHFSGDDSEISSKVKAFADLLKKKIDIEIVVFDERLTTKRAKQIMHENGEQPSRNKDRLNAIAAAVILHDFIEKSK